MHPAVVGRLFLSKGFFPRIRMSEKGRWAGRRRGGLPVRPIPELRRGSRPTGLPPGPPRWAVSARRDLFAAAGIPGVVGVLGRPSARAAGQIGMRRHVLTARRDRPQPAELVGAVRTGLGRRSPAPARIWSGVLAPLRPPLVPDLPAPPGRSPDRRGEGRKREADRATY